MPPKKKGNKKAQDDWEAELGETVDPIAQAAQQAKDDEAAKDAAENDQEGEEGGGGGLMAALRNRRKQKGKKGKPVEDFVEGEDPPAADGDGDAADGVNGDAVPDLEAKAPVEATMEDEDVFGAPAGGKKGKGGKGGKQEAKKVEAKKQDSEDEANEDGEDDEDAGGRVKTKKEKEKEKKEREKQRKKEQVSNGRHDGCWMIYRD